MEIFCFFLGIFYTYTWNSVLLLGASALFFITPRYLLIIGFFLGVIIALVHQHWIVPKGLPDLPVITKALIRGTVVSIPVQNLNRTQFLFSLEQLDNKPVQGLVQLNWYNRPHSKGVGTMSYTVPILHSGEKWEFTAKIKKPRNFQNPGSYDYETALKTRHIFRIGTIHFPHHQLISKPSSSWTWLSIREQLTQNLIQLAPNSQIAGVIEAVTLNITTHISQDDWNLFRRTGTTHLFGISGEHIALIAGLCTLIIRWLWSRNARWCLFMPAISIASTGGFVVAIFYAFLAGFAPPVQRALIGNLFYTLYCLGKRRFTPWQIWRYALVGVLCLEPHAVFMQGFYFSFLAVACLFLTKQRWNFRGYKGHLASQLSCLIGLMPLTLYWFSYGSFNGFIANAFAIPLVGLCIVPLALLTMVFSSFKWDWVLMKPLGSLITLLFKGLTWTEYLSVININCSIPQIIFVLAFMGALLMWVTLPVKPFLYLALLWLLIPLFPAYKPLAYGEARVQVLDVGQGLAVVIRTQHHTLLYDTGDQFFQGSDMGAMVILPFSQAEGISKLDKIVISHPDKDHRGGLNSVEQNLSVGELLVNDKHYYDHGSNCHDYPTWEWDGIQFRFFPIHQTFPDKNNNSCTLRVSNATGSVLFAGDIEQMGEDYLVQTYGNQLHSQVLIVPHHGSKTSASYRFLLEVAPLYAIASLGFDNRFHFPHAQTVARMKSLTIPFIRTDECGMVQITLPAQGVMEKPVCYGKS